MSKKIKLKEIIKIFKSVPPPSSPDDAPRYELEMRQKLSDLGYDPDEVARFMIETFKIPPSVLSPEK